MILLKKGVLFSAAIISRVMVAWSLLSVMYVLEWITPIKFIQDWMNEYGFIVQHISSFMFGWVDIWWMGVNKTESHILAFALFSLIERERILLPLKFEDSGLRSPSKLLKIFVFIFTILWFIILIAAIAILLPSWLGIAGSLLWITIIHFIAYIETLDLKERLGKANNHIGLPLQLRAAFLWFSSYGLAIACFHSLSSTIKLSPEFVWLLNSWEVSAYTVWNIVPILTGFELIPSTKEALTFSFFYISIVFMSDKLVINMPMVNLVSGEDKNRKMSPNEVKLLMLRKRRKECLRRFATRESGKGSRPLCNPNCWVFRD